jgi:hypothetical protein
MDEFYVGIKSLPDQCRISFTPYSGPIQAGYRPIADILVDGPPVELYIFVTTDESGKTVQKYRNGWQIVAQGDPVTIQKFGKWVAYIPVTLKQGDPPIAVG